MNKDKKRQVVLLVLAILIMVTLSVTATFAYFTATGTSDVINRYDISTPNIGRAYTQSGGDIELLVTGDMMKQSNSSATIPAATAKLDEILSLTLETSDSGGTIDCTYDIVYEPTAAYIKSIENINNAKEFTIMITSNLNGEITEEINLNNVSEKMILANDIKTSATGESIRKTELISAEVAFYNQVFNQDDNKNKSFGGKLYIENLQCTPTI